MAWLPIVIGLIGAPHAVYAATQQFCDTVPSTNTNWSTNLNLTQFDPSLGTLTAIDLSCAIADTQVLRVENRDTASCTANDTGTAQVTLTTPSSTTLVTSATNNFVASLAAFDGAIDFMGPSGATSAALMSSANANQAIPMGEFADFTGLGTVSIAAFATGFSNVTGCGNHVAQVNTSASANVCVTYTYSGPSPTPTRTLTRTPTTGPTGTFTSTWTLSPTPTVTGTPPTVTRTSTPTRTATRTRTATPSTNQVVCNDTTIGLHTTPWNDTLTVAKFDPSLGTLTGVEVYASTFVAQDLAIENLDTNPATVTGSGTGFIQVTLPAPPNPLQASVGTSIPPTLVAAFDGTLDFEGPSSASQTGQTGSATAVRSPYTPISDFIGPGSVSLPVHGDGFFSASGSGNLATQVNTQVSATVCVTYYYVLPTATVTRTATPTNTVPPSQTPTRTSTPTQVPASLGNFVWYDLDCDGVQDVGEPGVISSAVYLLNSSNVVIASTTTDASGIYGFNVAPGTYTVQFSQLSGYQFSTPGIGSSSTDSNASQSTGKSAAVTLSAGQNDPTIDAGLCLPATMTPTQTRTRTATSVAAVPTPTYTSVPSPTYPPGIVTPTVTSNAGPSPTETPFIDVALVQTNTGSFETCAIGTMDFTVRNMGTGSRVSTVGALTVVNLLPDTLTFVSGTGDGWTCTAIGQHFTCVHPALLAPNETTSFQVQVYVDEAAYPTVNNIARVSTLHDGNPENDTEAIAQVVRHGDCSQATPTPIVDIALVQTNTGSFETCSVGTIDFVIRNMGTGSRTETVGPLVLVDDLPASLTFVSATGNGWSCATEGQRLTCTYPTSLAPNELTALRIAVYADASAYPTLTNVATVFTLYDGNPQNNRETSEQVVRLGACASDPTPSPTATVTPLPAAAPAAGALTVSASRSVRVGRTGSVTLRLRKVAGPVTVQVQLPAELSATITSPFAEVSAGGLVTWVVGSAGGPLVTQTLKLKALATAPSANGAAVQISAVASGPTFSASGSDTVLIKP